MGLRDRTRFTRSFVAGAATILGIASAGSAQVPEGGPGALAIASEVAELRRLFLEQQRLLDQQARIISEQGRSIEALQRAASSASSQAPSEAAAPPGQAAPATEPREVNTDLPDRLVSAGDFPRSIRIPGTEAAFRLGGEARFTMVHTLAALGTDDRFVTSSIPVENDREAGEDGRVNYSASASRANLDIRTHSPVGRLRFFLESDFAGDNRTLRLRHAYLQTERWLGGQTWSTFSDPEADPRGLDFEGLNAISRFRQPQIRYTRALPRSFNVSLALEDPKPDLTGATGVNVVPDFVARVRWQPFVPRLIGRAQHLQTAVLVRGLGGEAPANPSDALATGGFGANVSGVFATYWDPDDRIKMAINAGWGIGRYITDLGALGGQDAVYDAVANELRALSLSSWYVGYERAWRPRFASTFTYGLVNVNNLDVQTGDSLHRTHRTSANFTWHPFEEASVVIEFLAGTRLNKDGKRGTSSQVQGGWLFRF